MILNMDTMFMDSEWICTYIKECVLFIECILSRIQKKGYMFGKLLRLCCGEADWQRTEQDRRAM